MRYLLIVGEPYDQRGCIFRRGQEFFKAKFEIKAILLRTIFFFHQMRLLGKSLGWRDLSVVMDLLQK